MNQDIIKGIAIIISVTLFLAILLACSYFLIRGIYFLFVAVGAKNEKYNELKNEGALPSSISMNPLNILLQTDLLTEEGRNYRKKGFRSILTFISICIVSLLASNLIEMI
jgi:hypothetical protein|tara:strand:- start:448 stop:777 length:330 start_codon:yes stop_codon:yes gene_type:complete